MKICIIGTGYVGLVGAAVFSDMGNTIIGVDKDVEKIAKIIKGEMPIYEPGLDEIVLRNLAEKRLSFTTSIKEGVENSDVIFICVGTPQGNTGAADLSAVINVSKSIGESLNGYKVIVTKSTVPVGTNERVEKTVRENAKPGAEFDIVSNPEFLKEGYAIEDMRNTNRTIVGAKSERAFKVMRELYKAFDAPIVECDIRSAEMIKYASNAFLATKISFINEIAQLCERAGANVDIVADGMGLDKRIGRAFLYPNEVGYGGSCFPKDVAALYKTSTDQAYDFKLLRSVMEVNDLQKFKYMQKITKFYGEDLSKLTIAVLGLSFKENTDDIRESGSIKIVRLLKGYGAKIRAFDPAAIGNTKKLLGDDYMYYANDVYDAVSGADAVCLLTEWSDIKNLDLDKTAKLVKEKVIFDARNLLNQQKTEDAGFTYFATGKRTNGYTEEGELSSALLKNGK